VIDTILLDAGGVILDETECERARAETAVQALSPIVPGYDMDAYWADVDDAVWLYVPRVYQYVLWKHCADDLDTFKRIRAEYDSMWKTKDPGITLMAGMDEVLTDLSADFDLVIAAQYGKNLLDLLEQHDLLRLFLNTLTQDDFKITKPDPRYYEQILARAGRTAAQSIMVGDRIDKDVIPAKMVGMRTIRVRTGIHRNQEPRIPSEFPDADVRSVLDIPNAARRIACGE
jgi:HAD superfamily hydrolase (TIGR01549 family)